MQITREMVKQLTQEELATVATWISERRELMAARARNTLYVGQRVRFMNNRRGRYMTGTVTAINRKLVVVDCGSFDGRWKVYPANLLPVSLTSSEEHRNTYAHVGLASKPIMPSAYTSDADAEDSDEAGEI